jgi:transcriptional regulator with XRE-family HTH domain
MERNSEQEVSTVDRDGNPYGARLKRARELAGKSPREIAPLVGVSLPQYYDWEEQEGGLNMVASLRELSTLASILGVRARSFFDDEPKDAVGISPGELSAMVKARLDAVGMGVAEERGQPIVWILEECRGFFSSVFRAPKTPKFFPLW